VKLLVDVFKKKKLCKDYLRNIIMIFSYLVNEKLKIKYYLGKIGTLDSVGPSQKRARVRTL
jgi:hypothetical protein